MLSAKNNLLDLTAGNHKLTFTFSGSHSKCPKIPFTVTYNFDANTVNYVHINELGTFHGKVKAQKPTEGIGESLIGYDILKSHKS